MLNSAITDFLSDQVSNKTCAASLKPKALRVAAAVSYLKGKDPFKAESTIETGVSLNSSVAEVVNLGTYSNKHGAVSGNNSLTSAIDRITNVLAIDTRPVSQLRDRELLERYARDRDYDCEKELSLRSKNEPFIVLGGPIGEVEGACNEPSALGREPIDIEESLILLKRAHKGRVNSTIIPYKDSVVNVYRISELNLDDRRVELCPICSGESLYKGYCERCGLNFKSIGSNERAYMKLVVSDSGLFQKESYSDRKALYASASKGINNLRITWPSVSKLYDSLEESGDLPKLVLIESRPPTMKADPFHVNGNRTY